jgi:hypothetical protein
MMKKKGAIGLSINMIVMVLISLAILSAGVVLLNKFVSGAEDIKDQLDKRTEERLNDIVVSQGKRVALPFYTSNVKRGGEHVFGIGILNTGDVGNEFTLSVESIKLISPTGEDLTSVAGDFSNWARYDQDVLIIDEGKHLKKSILVKVPKGAVSGTYAFTARIILANRQQYGNRQDFFVIVS